MVVEQALEVIEFLDYEFEVPCDHETCEREADYLLLLSCPACTYNEKFFICEPHWSQVSGRKELVATCSKCEVYGSLEDFLVECRRIR